ncbi:hypothetical protein ACHAXA_001171 [Cyclostephanos tholiformis]|uniref:Transport protein particle component n=1 Tax=Cyclostephanos tholiformis TaxID=382380 RepID=A0ABD3R7E0_9STRA
MATVAGHTPPIHARSASSAIPTPPASSKTVPSSSSHPNNAAAAAAAATTATTEHVAECAYEFLLAGIIQWVEREEKRMVYMARAVSAARHNRSGGDSGAIAGDDGARAAGKGADPDEPPSSTTAGDVIDAPTPAEDDDDDGNDGKDDEAATAAAIMAAERSAARIERMGYDVGYRLCERLAQHRPLLGPGSPSPETGAVDVPPSIAVTSGKTTDRGPIIMGGGGHHTVMDAGTQLEAVKFLCKEFWTEVFRKQIDKLQTNHRGVFVLKDHELRWLRRLPPDVEGARVGAIRILAFPCGLIRGALACLGLSGAIVSCDFLADGKAMASCSFNIKVK